MNYVPFLLLLGLLACENSAQQTAAPVYYDVAGYVKNQIDALTRLQPLVTKRAQMGDETERQTTRAVNWGRELELFAQADINKPALRTSYAIARPDSLTYLYTLKPGEKNLTIRSLIVQLDAATRQPRRIEATLISENSLYTSERAIVMESGPRGRGGWGLTHYRLRGFQHLRLSDKNTFDVEGNVQP